MHSYYPPPASSSVIVSAPMSFTGSAQRIWRLTAGYAGWAAAGMGALAVFLIAVVWTLVACWYLIFGLLLVPYRIIRRGQRKARRDQLRHEETMRALYERDRYPR